MKRTSILLACLGALIVMGCTSDSSLPTATGQGTIRALNAIPESPGILVLIEERAMGTLSYQQSTSQNRWDDIEYNFNFEVFLPGSLEPDRVLTYPHKLEADREDTLLLTGDIENPTVTVWSKPTREWTETDTVFEAQFAHVIEAEDAIDFYLDEAVEPAVVANKVATLSYGQVSDVSDFLEGTYTVTITVAGNIDAIIFQSSGVSFAARTSHILAALAGDENDSSSVIVSILNNLGNDRKLPGSLATQTVRFFHASFAMQTTDIYDDDLLTSLKVSGLAYGEASGDVDVSREAETYYYTLTGSTAAILHQTDMLVPRGRHANLYVLGPADDYLSFSMLPDRAAVSIYAKLQLFNASLESGNINVYIKDADDPLVEEDLPYIVALPYPAPSPIQALNAGSYDVYVTPVGEKTVLGGPLRLDLVNGDVVDLLALDTDTPGVVELKVVPAP